MNSDTIITIQSQDRLFHFTTNGEGWTVIKQIGGKSDYLINGLSDNGLLSLMGDIMQDLD